MTKTQEIRTRRALKLVDKCNGDCKHCEHVRVPAKGSFYAFLCGIADEAGYAPYSNTLAELKRATLDCLKFELGIDDPADDTEIAFVRENEFGLTYCKTCNADILADEYGNFPNNCPGCDGKLNWSEWEKYDSVEVD